MYRINEIFYSIQGEGVQAGLPMVFVRFAGCNVACRLETQGFDCDTEFVSSVEMSAEEIVAEVSKLWTLPDPIKVLFTGGEPALQLDDSLLSAFLNAGRGSYWSIETNGTISLGKLAWRLDWVTVSPKKKTAIEQKRADEIKIVLAAGEIPNDHGIRATHRLISPVFQGNVVDAESLRWCIEYVKRVPWWRLSVQQHKGWGIL